MGRLGASARRVVHSSIALDRDARRADTAVMESSPTLERRTVRLSRGVCPTARDSAMFYGAQLTVAQLELKLAAADARIAELEGLVFTNRQEDY